MLNQIILVGRITENPMCEKDNDGKQKTIIKLEIKRSFKNPDTNDFDSDIITVKLWSDIASQASDQLKIGSLVGVKGRVQQTMIETVKGLINIPEILGEKITFISARN